MLLGNNLINTILHQLEPSWGHAQAPHPLPRPPAEGEGREAHPLLTVSCRSPERSGQMKGVRKACEAPSARAPHRPPPLIAPAGCPPAAGASGACPSAAGWPRLVGSPLSGGCGAAHLEREGWGRGGARGEGSPGADFRSRGNPPKTPGNPRPRAPDQARERPGVPAAGCRGSLPGGAGRRAAGAYRWLRGTPGLQSRRRGFPGLGERRLSSSHAVTASDVSASPRTEGTRGGAGFWESRELCPRSCSKKPNPKANL